VTTVVRSRSSSSTRAGAKTSSGGRPSVVLRQGDRLQGPTSDDEPGGGRDSRCLGRRARRLAHRSSRADLSGLGQSRAHQLEVGGFIDESLRRVGPMLDPCPTARSSNSTSLTAPLRTREFICPRNGESRTSRRRRLVFDEFLRLQLLLRASSTADGRVLGGHPSPHQRRRPRRRTWGHGGRLVDARATFLGGASFRSDARPASRARRDRG